MRQQPRVRRMSNGRKVWSDFKGGRVNARVARRPLRSGPER